MGPFLYLCQVDYKPEDVFSPNLSRLRRIKATYDPTKGGHREEVMIELLL